MANNEKIGILGAGGMARETAAYSLGRVSFFAVNRQFMPDNSEGFIDIENPDLNQAETGIVAALGAPAVRRAMVESWPGREYANLIAQSAEIYTERLGKGVIIAPRAVVTTGVEIGDHTIINVDATVSHDCILGDYVTVCPGAHIAGNVTLEDGVFIGIGAVVSNNIFIASGTVVGAGAVVVKDITVPNSVVVGNPAKTVRVQDDWLKDV